MTDFISREKAIETIQYRVCQGHGNKEHICKRGSCAYCGIMEIMEDISSIEATGCTSVNHGYWEEVTDYGGWGDTHYRCSVCGEEWYLEDGKPRDNNMNFCPRCGAKMDAEPDEPWQSE